MRGRRKDYSFIVIFPSIFLPYPTSKTFQHNPIALRAFRQKANAITAASKPCVDGIVPYLSQGQSPLHPILCPHSRQNLEPAGICLPHSGQNIAVLILSPQDRQNFEFAGILVPHFGQTVTAVFCDEKLDWAA